MNELSALKTLPIAITPDEALSPEKFWASLELPFPVLIDPNNEVAARYGAAWPTTNKTRRATTIVDTNGIVLFHQIGGPTLETLFEALRGADQGMTPAALS
jgi:peroxiredoxin